MGNFSIWHFAIVGGFGWLLLSVLGSKRGNTPPYVIKEWFANETPNRDGIYVQITGRKGGLMSWLLSFVGIDPTVSFVVDHENARFTRGSWTGFTSSVTPLEKICSGSYGYSKPFWGTAFCMGVGVAILLSSNGIFPVIVSLIVIAGASAYYFLNKTLVLGLTFVSGDLSNRLTFKRSLIEGINIDENNAAKVIHIIETLVKQGSVPAQAASRWATEASSPEPAVEETTVTGQQATRSPTAAAIIAFCPECGTNNTDASAVCKGCGTALV